MYHEVMTPYLVKPTSVPAMVAVHQDCLRTPVYHRYATTMYELDLRAMLVGEKHRSPETKIFGDRMSELADMVDNPAVMADLGRRWCNDEANRLNISTLFHVTEQMLAVAIAAARKLDDEKDVWTTDVLPSLTGILVFERPLYILDSRGVQTSVGAMSWHHYDANNAWNGHRTNIEISQFSTANDPADAYSMVIDKSVMPDGRSVTSTLGPWHLVSIGAVPYGTGVGPMTWNKYDKEILDEVLNSLDGEVTGPEMALVNDLEVNDPLVSYPIEIINVNRVLYAIFLLMQQEIADLEEWSDRRIARRNKGKRRPPSQVTIIRLRRPEQFGARESDGGTWLTYRSVTRSHWRRQHYADGTTKRIFIHSYWRGPKDAPIFQPTRVTTLQR